MHFGQYDSCFFQFVGIINNLLLLRLFFNFLLDRAWRFWIEKTYTIFFKSFEVLQSHLIIVCAIKVWFLSLYQSTLSWNSHWFASFFWRRLLSVLNTHFSLGLLLSFFTICNWCLIIFDWCNTMLRTVKHVLKECSFFKVFFLCWAFLGGTICTCLWNWTHLVLNHLSLKSYQKLL